MKFVYFGYDFMLPAIRRLITEGHKLTGIFTFPCDNIFNFNRETLHLAQEYSIPVTLENPSATHIKYFSDNATECFLAAGYPWKIPVIDTAYAINLHPSLLPKGRGIMPTPHIIINHPEASGFTIHKLARGFDAGDILYQEALPVSPTETVKTLSTRTLERGTEALSKVMRDLPRYWEKATPQNEAEATHFPPPDMNMRLLNWNKPVDEIDRTARAFGHYGSLAQFDDSLWVVFSHEISKENPGAGAGTILSRSDNIITIAALDGVVKLKQWEQFSG
jgi:methionyl-tRNA formyltransferase